MRQAQWGDGELEAAAAREKRFYNSRMVMNEHGVAASQGSLSAASGLMLGTGGSRATP